MCYERSLRVLVAKEVCPIMSKSRMISSLSVCRYRGQWALRILRRPLSTESRDRFIVRSPLSDCELENVPLHQYLFRRMELFPDLTALQCGVTGKTYKYAELHRAARKFGGVLQRLKLRKGDTLGLVLNNCPDFAVIVLGAFAAGITVSPANPNYTSDEITRQFSACSAKIVIAQDDIAQKITPDLSKMPTAKHFICTFGKVDGWTSYEEILEEADTFVNEPVVDLGNDTMLLPYSSGTTGLPKGVMLTHENLVSNLCQIHHPGVAKLQHATSGFQERLLCILPFFHIYGFNGVLMSGLWQGSLLTTLPKFEPDQFIKTLERTKPTAIHLVPPIISFLGNSKKFNPKSMELTHTLFSGAAPLGPAAANKLLERINNPDLVLQEGCGMTETSPVATLSPLVGWKVGSCGVPVPRTEVKIVDVSTGESLPEEGEGEMCIRGPQVMKGYFQNEKATKDMIDEDGWLHTGDIAKYDSDGQFWIVDRLKELIKVKGLQVAPSELEDLLRTHSDIEDVAVIGIPDERMGEVPRAYVVRKIGSSLEEHSVLRFVSGAVSDHKQLRGGVHFVESIPKATSGKILRRELKMEALKSL